MWRGSSTRKRPQGLHTELLDLRAEHSLWGADKQQVSQGSRRIGTARGYDRQRDEDDDLDGGSRGGEQVNDF